MSQCRQCGNEVTSAFCTFCGAPASGPGLWAPQDPAEADTQLGAGPSADPFLAGQPAGTTPADYAVPPLQPYTPPAQPYTPPAQPYPAPQPYPAAQQYLPGGQGGYPPVPGQPTPVLPVPGYVQAANSRGGRPILPILAGVLALAVVGVGVLVVPRLLDPGTPRATVTTTRTPSPAPASSTLQPATTAPITTLTPVAVPPATNAGNAEASALASLQSKASAQQGQLNAAVASHQWLAQLSSKYVGISDPLQTTASGSHTFLAADILAEHRQLAGRVTDATVILGDSRTFGKGLSFNGQPYWRTMAISPAFASSDAVKAWCARTFPELTGAPLTNQCLPMQF